jgi:hypothetical protein
MTSRALYSWSIVLATLAVAGFTTMIVLLTTAPTAQLPYANTTAGHIEVDCRSIPEAADVTNDDRDSVTDVHADGSSEYADRPPQLAWCAEARTARVGYLGLLAVPTTLAAGGAIATVRAGGRRAR